MQTVRSVITHMLPSGTGERTGGKWSKSPLWPPDLFAIAGTLVSLSSCYAQTQYLCGFDDCTFNDAYREKVRDHAALIANGLKSDAVEEAWTKLLSRTWKLQDAKTTEEREWWDAAMFLLAVADVASIGVGFATDLDTSTAILTLKAYTTGDTKRLL